MYACMCRVIQCRRGYLDITVSGRFPVGTLSRPNCAPNMLVWSSRVSSRASNNPVWFGMAYADQILILFFILA